SYLYSTRPPRSTLFPYTTLFRSINEFKILGGLFDLEQKQANIEQLELKMTSPDFWDDQNGAQEVIDELNSLKKQVEDFTSLISRMDDIETMFELVNETDDEEMKQEENAEKNFELEMLLSEPYDKNNAILELHPGAGGTESQDWASILLRMYQRWAEHKHYKVETLNYLAGDEAGVKSVTLLIKGHNAYGYLK